MVLMGIYRQDVYEIPPDAIRELIINAMVHRSYLDHGTIQVAVYDNRLEITSPGKLSMGQTLERMKEGYSKIRNEALAHAFAYMNLIEHWGSGMGAAVCGTAGKECRFFWGSGRSVSGGMVSDLSADAAGAIFEKRIFPDGAAERY